LGRIRAPWWGDRGCGRGASMPRVRWRVLFLLSRPGTFVTADPRSGLFGRNERSGGQPASPARDLIRRRSSPHSPNDGPVGTLWSGSPEGGGSGGGLSMRCIVAPFIRSPAVRMRWSGRSARRRRTRARGCEARGPACCVVSCWSDLRAAEEGIRARLWRRTGRRILLAAVPSSGSISSWLAYTAARRFSTTTSGIFGLVDIANQPTRTLGHFPRPSLSRVGPELRPGREGDAPSWAMRGNAGQSVRGETDKRPESAPMRDVWSATLDRGL
jgi:hypothetical protein